MFRNITLILVAAAFCCAAQGVTTSGQDAAASKQAKVEELFRVLKMDVVLRKTLDLVADQAKSGAMRQILGVHVEPTQQKIIDDMQDKLKQILSDTLSWEHLEPIYAKLYADNFSEPEIDAVLAFYKSPAGQAFVEKSPELMSQSTALIQQQMMTAQPEIRQLMAETMQKMKENGAGK